MSYLNESCIIIPNLKAALQVASFTASLSTVALSRRNMHLPAHPITAASPREMVEETHCNTPTVHVLRSAIFVCGHNMWCVMWAKLIL